MELALAEKGSRHRLEELSHASLDVHHGIDAFEINMKRLVKADAGEGEGVGPAGSGPVGRSPLEHMSKLQGMASSGAALLEGSAVYMKGVKEGRAEDVAARKEREVGPQTSGARVSPRLSRWEAGTRCHQSPPSRERVHLEPAPVVASASDRRAFRPHERCLTRRATLASYTCCDVMRETCQPLCDPWGRCQGGWVGLWP